MKTSLSIQRSRLSQVVLLSWYMFTHTTRDGVVHSMSYGSRCLVCGGLVLSFLQARPAGRMSKPAF